MAANACSFFTFPSGSSILKKYQSFVKSPLFVHHHLKVSSAVEKLFSRKQIKIGEKIFRNYY
jgi:hypothetical protein